MPQLDPAFFASQLFWLALCFAALFFLVSKSLLPTVSGILNARKETLEGNVAEAEKSRNQAEKLQKDQDEAMAEARSRARQVIAESLEKSKAKLAEKRAQMNAEINVKIKEAESRILTLEKDADRIAGEVASETAARIVAKISGSGPSQDQVSSAVKRAA